MRYCLRLILPDIEYLLEHFVAFELLLNRLLVSTAKVKDNLSVPVICIHPAAVFAPVISVELFFLKMVWDEYEW